MSDENVDQRVEEQQTDQQVEQQEVDQPEEQQEEMSAKTRTAYEVIQGGWGPGGNYTRKLLIDAGHNPYEVEEEVERIRKEKENQQQ